MMIEELLNVAATLPILHSRALNRYASFSIHSAMGLYPLWASANVTGEELPPYAAYLAAVRNSFLYEGFIFWENRSGEASPLCKKPNGDGGRTATRPRQLRYPG